MLESTFLQLAESHSPPQPGIRYSGREYFRRDATQTLFAIVERPDDRTAGPSQVLTPARFAVDSQTLTHRIDVVLERVIIHHRRHRACQSPLLPA